MRLVNLIPDLIQYPPKPASLNFLRMLVKLIAVPPVPEHFTRLRSQITMPRLYLRAHLVVVVTWRMSDRYWLFTIQNSFSLVLARFKLIGKLSTVSTIDPCNSRMLKDQ
jgi:hypothetical protein